MAILPTYDLPWQQHPAGFAAYKPRADHTVMDFKIVLGLKLLYDHIPHVFIVRAHDVAHAVTLAANVQNRVIFYAGGVEEALPAVHVFTGEDSSLRSE